MPRRGENIYKRKDGRWEARYIYSFKEDGSPRYRSIYAADYLTVKKKQNDAKRKMDPRLFQSVRMKKNISFYGLLWLERLKPSSKESTYVRYHYLFSHYISPMIGDRLVYTFSNKDCEVFLNKLLLSGKSDGSGLAPKTVTDIRSVIKLILKTAEKEGELSLCNPELCPVKPVRKPLRILSLKEQQALQDYLLGNLTHKNIGTLIALYTGVRLGELCAMQWKDIHFQEQYLEISKTLHRVKDHTVDCLLCLYQPFMELWVGRDLMLSFSAVVCFVVYFFVRQLNSLFNMYKDASGMWHEDRFRPLVAALTNLVLNLILVQFIGIYGILISTVLAIICVGMPWLLHNLFTVIFEKKHLLGYLKELLYYCCVIVVSCIATYFICSKINVDLIATLVIRGTICVILPNLIYLLAYYKRIEFTDSLLLVNKMTKGKLRGFLTKLGMRE